MMRLFWWAFWIALCVWHAVKYPLSGMISNTTAHYAYIAAMAVGSIWVLKSMEKKGEA